MSDKRDKVYEEVGRFYFSRLQIFENFVSLPVRIYN